MDSIKKDHAKTVYILGAGASSFAGFPLAGDLWKFLKKETGSADHQTRISGKRWIDAVEKVIVHLGADQESPDLELISTLIDLSEKNPGVLGAVHLPDLRDARYGFARLVTSAFQWHSMRVGAWIFNETENERLDWSGRPLNRRKFLDVIQAWANLVNGGDTIITFNWDLLHEMILFKAEKWDHGKGYGFQFSPARAIQSRVIVLKLHGSCNWALRSTDEKPFVDYADQFFPVPNPEVHTEDQDPSLGETADHGESLILPSYLKDPTKKPVVFAVWTQAQSALQHANKIIVLGYSLPPADAPTRTMISLALRQNLRLDGVQVALGSDGAAYARWEDICDAAGKRVRPIHQTFEEFVLDRPFVS